MTLSESDVEARAAVMHCVDAQECGACGRPIPAGAASDAGWFLDTHAEADGSVLADIRCPECW